MRADLRVKHECRIAYRERFERFWNEMKNRQTTLIKVKRICSKRNAWSGKIG